MNESTSLSPVSSGEQRNAPQMTNGHHPRQNSHSSDESPPSDIQPSPERAYKLIEQLGQIVADEELMASMPRRPDPVTAMRLIKWLVPHAELEVLFFVL
uniref:Uncharacterized protein n=1 Tax=Plectus sambesii TaxID=2011161 RepID=A0A914UL13_9BILA